MRRTKKTASIPLGKDRERKKQTFVPDSQVVASWSRLKSDTKQRSITPNNLRRLGLHCSTEMSIDSSLEDFP
jgi:hypothetical protein